MSRKTDELLDEAIDKLEKDAMKWNSFRTTLSLEGIRIDCSEIKDFAIIFQEKLDRDIDHEVSITDVRTLKQVLLNGIKKIKEDKGF